MMANRQRSPNFTTEETFFLLESLEKVIHVIENKKNRWEKRQRERGRMAGSGESV